MKSTLYTVLIVSIAIISFLPKNGIAQKKKAKNNEVQVQTPNFNYDDKTQLITYVGSYSSNGTSIELYNKAMEWFKSNFKNSGSLIKERNDGSSFTAKPRFRTFSILESGQKFPGDIISYTLHLSFSDGNYNFRIDKINIKNPSYLGLEKWDAENKVKYVKHYAEGLAQSDEEIQRVIKSLKEAMK